jgi:hypothetical protein
MNRNGLGNMLGGPIGKVLVTLKLGLMLEDKVGLFTFSLVNILPISLFNNASNKGSPTLRLFTHLPIFTQVIVLNFKLHMRRRGLPHYLVYNLIIMRGTIKHLIRNRVG